MPNVEQVNRPRAEKPMTRIVLMQALANRFPGMFLKTTEEFGTAAGGIWTVAEGEAPEDDGLPIFSNEAMVDGWAGYDCGVLNTFSEYLLYHGWIAEWYDGGTMMLWRV